MRSERTTRLLNWWLTLPFGASQRRVATDALIAAGVTLVTGVLFAWAFPDAPLHPDSLRDLLTARDCLDGAGCAGEGAPSSIRTFVQGALWHRTLALLLHGQAGIQTMLVGFHTLVALAIGLLVWCASRQFRLRAWWLVALVALATFRLWLSMPLLWNPLLMPLPLVLLFWLLCLVAARGSTVAAGLAGVALWGVVEAHLLGVALLPAVLLVTLLCARRPLLGLALQMGALGGLSWLTSEAAWRRNLFALSLDEVGAAAVGFAVLGWLAWQARPVVRRVSNEQRLGLVPWLMVISFIGVMLVAQLTQPFFFASRYSLLLVPALAMLLTGALVRLGGWLEQRHRLFRHAKWAPLPLLLLVALPQPWRPQDCSRPVPTMGGGVPVLRYSLTDAERIARALQDQALPFATVARALRGPMTRELLPMLALHAPALPTTGHETHAPIQHLPLCRARLPASLPAEWRTVPLDHDRVALLGSRPGWVPAQEGSFCLETMEGADRECVAITPASLSVADGSPARFRDFAYPQHRGLPELREEWLRAHEDRFREVYEVPIAPQGDDRARTLQLLAAPEARVFWTVDRIEGLRADISPARDRLTVRRDGEARGKLRLSREGQRHAWASEVGPPELLELTGAETDLVEAMR